MNKLIVSLWLASIRRCSRCGGGLSLIGVLIVAFLTSACTAAGMSRMQASHRAAVAICASAEALRAAGADAEVRRESERWCARAIRLAATETESATVSLERAIEASRDAGMPVPPAMESTDAGLPAIKDAGAGFQTPGGPPDEPEN